MCYSCCGGRRSRLGHAAHDIGFGSGRTTGHVGAAQMIILLIAVFVSSLFVSLSLSLSHTCSADTFPALFLLRISIETWLCLITKVQKRLVRFFFHDIADSSPLVNPSLLYTRRIGPS
jgi:hypothetical protein